MLSGIQNEIEKACRAWAWAHKKKHGEGEGEGEELPQSKCSYSLSEKSLPVLKYMLYY